MGGDGEVGGVVGGEEGRAKDRGGEGGVVCLLLW